MTKDEARGKSTPFDPEEAVMLREQGWGWRKIGEYYGESEEWARNHVRPLCITAEELGITDEEAREVYQQYTELANLSALEEATGRPTVFWRTVFRRLGLPLVPARRRNRGLYTATSIPRCSRCGIALRETRYRDGMCVECILETCGRLDLAIQYRGVLLTNGELPPLPEPEVDALLAQVGVSLQQPAEVREVSELAQIPA